MVNPNSPGQPLAADGEEGARLHCHIALHNTSYPLVASPPEVLLTGSFGVGGYVAPAVFENLNQYPDRTEHKQRLGCRLLFRCPTAITSISTNPRQLYHAKIVRESPVQTV